MVCGEGEPTGSALVTHPDVDMVSLTGSPATGRWIASAAAETLKRVHLELGGKAPVVVFDDVDLSSALETIAGTGYYNAGQDCTAATRVLAADSVYDDVVGGLAEQAQRARDGGHPRGGHDAGSPELGPPARARRGLPGAPRARGRGRHRRPRPGRARATSSSPPSSPASSRATRWSSRRSSAR